MRGRLQSAAKAGCEQALATHTADTLLSTPCVQLLSREGQSVSWFSKGVARWQRTGTCLACGLQQEGQVSNSLGDAGLTLVVMPRRLHSPHHFVCVHRVTCAQPIVALDDCVRRGAAYADSLHPQPAVFHARVTLDTRKQRTARLYDKP